MVLCYRDIDGTATEEEKKCCCRAVSEAELEPAVLEAVNRLPGMWEMLIRKQASIWDGDLKRIDVLIENNRSQSEKETQEDKIALLTDERNRLLLERAETANREMHIRLLLELAEILKGSAVEGREEAACMDYEDFFHRTKPEIRCEEGVITEHTPDLVTRYIDRLMVKTEGYEVIFKGGVTVEIGEEAKHNHLDFCTYEFGDF